MTLAIGILIFVCAIFLVVAVLLQSSKNHRMSGVISGGAETFFGKQKGKTIDAKLSKATAIIAAVFALLVLALYLVNAHNQQSVLDNVVNDNVITDTEAGTEEADGEENAETESTETENTESAETENTESAETENTENAETAETEGTETEGEADAADKE